MYSRGYNRKAIKGRHGVIRVHGTSLKSILASSVIALVAPFLFLLFYLVNYKQLKGRRSMTLEDFKLYYEPLKRDRKK
jgi:hypothetical protein